MTPEDIQEIRVKKADGSIWTADVRDGKLNLLTKLSSPAPSGEPTAPGGTGLEVVLRPPSDGLLTMEVDSKEEAESSPPLPPITDNVFRSKLSSIMTDNKYDRRTRGKTRGKLDMQRLWKAPVGATNLFTKKESRKNKEYNIVLLVDESGSMGKNNRIEKAADITCFLGRTFEGLNLNLAIVGFNTFIMEHKGFDETIDYSQLHQTITQNISGENGGYDNNDFDALAYGYSLFKGRSGQNLLIMMSDGSPDESEMIDHLMSNPDAKREVKPKDPMGKSFTFWYDESSKLTSGEREKEVHIRALVKANANVESIGIGIQSECWQIPNSIRVDSLEKLKPMLLRELQKKIKRG